MKEITGKVSLTMEEIYEISSEIVEILPENSNLTESSIVEILQNKEKRPMKEIRKLFLSLGIKLSNEKMGELGGIIGKKLEDKKVKLVETFEFDWEAGEFSDSGSCFWGHRSMAKKLLLENGGGIYKIFSEKEKSRCLFIPYRSGRIIFNIYSSEGISLEDVARILTENSGEKYREVRLYSESPVLYINKNRGIFISPNEDEFMEEEITLLPEYSCDNCGKKIDWYDFRFDENEITCQSCQTVKIFCEHCGKELDADSTEWVNGSPYCEICIEKLFFRCENCGVLHPHSEGTEVNGKIYCRVCFESKFTTCHYCGKYIFRSLSPVVEGKYLCRKCFGKHTKTCDSCGETFLEKNLMRMGEEYICKKCFEKGIKNLEFFEEFSFGKEKKWKNL